MKFKHQNFLFFLSYLDYFLYPRRLNLENNATQRPKLHLPKSILCDCSPWLLAYFISSSFNFRREDFFFPPLLNKGAWKT